MDKLKIIECFNSFQGEGSSVGSPAVFLRLAECNLRCSFCDEYLKLNSSKEYTIEETINLIKEEMSYLPPSNKLLIITGGEPLLQYEPLVKLCEKLYEQIPSLEIHIETNGTQQKELNIDKYVVSPKTIMYSNLKKTFTYFNNIKPFSEFKIVVTLFNINILFSILNELDSENLIKNTIYLQPETSQAKQITDKILEGWDILTFSAKISTQTHIFLRQR